MSPTYNGLYKKLIIFTKSSLAMLGFLILTSCSDGTGSGGNEAPPATAPQVPVDFQASIVINSGAVKTADTLVSLALQAVGATEMKVSTDSTCSQGAWEAFSNSKSWTLDSLNTINTVYFQVRSNDGVSACVSDSILHDSVPPVVELTSLSENDFVNSVTMSAVVLSGSCSENGIDVQISGAATATAACVSGVFSSSVDVSDLADGAHQFVISQVDDVGNMGSSTRNFIKDTLGPSAIGLAINSGALYTNSLNVTLDLSAVGASQMWVSDSALCLSGSWEAFSASKPYVLSALNSVNSVYVKYRDLAFNETACIMASIAHDNVVPTIEVTSPTANSIVNSLNQASFAVSGTCSEDGQNVVFSGAATGSTLCSAGAFSETLNFTAAAQGNITLNVATTDLAGNTGNTSIIYFKDSLAPTENSLTLEMGALATKETHLSVGLASVGAVDMYLTENASCDSGGVWESYSTSKTWNFTDQDTTLRLYVRFRDAAGNISACVNDSILQDSTPPDWIDSPIHAGIFNSETESPEVSFVDSASDSGSGVQKYQYAVGTGTSGAAIDNIKSWTDIGSSPFVASALTLIEAQTYFINMRVLDQVGNETLRSSTGWLVDLTPPSVTVTAPLDNTVLYEEDFKVTGTCEVAAGPVLIDLPGSLAGPATTSCNAGGSFFFFLQALSAGSHTFQVSQSDGLNNPVEVPVTVEWRRPIEFSGTVHAMKPLPDGSVLYGGNFNSVTIGRSYSLARAFVTGEKDSSFNLGSGFNGQIFAIHELDDGSVLVGGDFTTYRGRTANRFARILANGDLDTTISPQTGGNGFNSVVNAIAVRGSGASAEIYITGQFTSYRGVTNSAPRLAKLNLSGALDTSFVLPNNALNSTGRALLVFNDKIYVGGDFTSYRGAVANRIARLNLDGTLDTGFNPSSGGNGANNVVRAIISDGASVYIGGDFTQIRGLSANRIAKLDANGNRDAAFSPAANGANTGGVFALAFDGSHIYLGGSFTSYRGTSVNRIAKINTDGSLVTAFSTATVVGFNSTVNSLQSVSDGIVAGGAFTTYRGQDINYVVKLDPTNGSVDSSFHPSSGPAGASYNVNAVHLGAQSGRLWIGGAFTHYREGIYLANNFARILADGTLDETLSPQSGPSGFNTTVRGFDISTTGEDLYVVGDFRFYKGQPANFIAKISLDTGELDTIFNPNSAANGVNNIARAVEYVDDDTIFFGGDFTSYLAPTPRTVNRIMRLNSSGQINPTFNPSSGGNGTGTGSVMSLLWVSNSLYVGGSFTTYRSTTVNRIAKVDSNGVLDTGFSAGVGFSSTVNSIATDGTSLFFGGAFTSFKGAVANRVAKTDLAGVLDATFSPASGGNGASTTVNSVAYCTVGGSGAVYIAGAFTSYRGSTANRVAKLGLSGALDTTFTADGGVAANGSPVLLAAACSSDTVLFGGAFRTYRNKSMSNVLRVNSSGDPN